MVEKTNNFILLTEFEPRERVAEGIVTFGLFGVLRKIRFPSRRNKNASSANREKRHRLMTC